METVIVSNNVATGSNNAVSTTPRATTTAPATTSNNKVATYSPPSSPASSTSSSTGPSSPILLINGHQHGNSNSNSNTSIANNRRPSLTPVSGVVHGNQDVSSSSPSSPALTYSPTTLLYTPIKSNSTAYHQKQYQHQQQSPELQQSPESITLGKREKLLSPGDIIKGRYLLTSHRYHMSAAAAAKTPASYRHLIDLTSSHQRCTDIFTGKQYLCKIINEPLHKVQRAYFQLLQLDAENCQSSIYGHALIRGAHDIVPLNEHRTYVVIAPPPPPSSSTSATMANSGQQDLNGSGSGSGNNAVDYLYEDLHTYLRNKRRLCEPEARSLFHQICQTVQVCHRNGVILRDLKLRRFHFIDEARTKLQYESLEGSMILDDPADDTLREKIGCPLYTAPELLCPNATYRGKPADMWSLGVLLYTMLVGQYPFYEKANYCSLITVIRHCQVQIPSMLSRSVRWLLLSLLRKNHEERMRAEHILFSPWLREQRPYYMSVPVNVSVPMDDDDMETEEDIDNSEECDEDCLLAAEHECESEIVMTKGTSATSTSIAASINSTSVSDTSSSTVSSSTSTTSTMSTSISTSIPASTHRTRRADIAEPLDYTCATLQFVARRPSATDDDSTRDNDHSIDNDNTNDNDVDMG